MIKYQLKCDQDHQFESWFASSDAFEKLRKTSMIACTGCGSTRVEKSLMAPKVTPARQKAAAPVLTKPKNEGEKAIADMRDQVEKNSEYVGLNFASEARSMHLGETENRSIYGEAKLEEAKSLIDEGIPVAPLPFMPKRNTN